MQEKPASTAVLDPVPEVGLAGPVPAPSPSLPARVAIPDGPPSTAALSLLASVDPTLIGTTQARLDAARTELAEWVERCRLSDPPTGRNARPMELSEFITHAARLVNLRRTLQGRLAALSGKRADDQPASAEVADLILSVRRWRPAVELQAARERLVAKLRGELDQVEGHIQSAVATIRSGSEMTITRPVPVDGVRPPDDPHRTGLVHQQDEALRRLTALLARRQDLRGRLARLDADGDDGRSELVREAIAAAGGVDAVAGALAPSQPAPSAEELAEAQRAISRIGAQLDHIDPETQEAARLVSRRDEVTQRLADLAARAVEERDRSARALLTDALGGGLAAIGRLQSAVRSVRPELADALAGIRGDRSALVAIVAEMMA